MYTVDPHRSSRGRSYRVGDLVVDASRGCLLRGGQEVHLRQKTLQVLLYLLDHHHRLVTKEELHEHIWKDAAVTEDALVQCIVDIRRTFGDNSREPTFLRTIPRVGYRVVAPVEVLPDGPGVEVTAAPAPAAVVGMDLESGAVTKRWLERALPGRSQWASSLSPGALLKGSGVAAVLVLALGAWWFPWGQPPADIRLVKEEGRKAVVVLPFANRAGTRELNWLREGIADMLITDLAQWQGVSVPSRQQLATLLQQVGYDPDAELALDQALEVGRRAGADVVLLGGFASLEGSVRIDVTLYDVAKGTMLATDRLVPESADRLLRDIDLLSLNLARHLGIGATEPADHRLAEAMTDNLAAYRFYSLAVQKANALHNVEALKLLEQAVALDPTFAMAHARIGYTYAITWGYADKGRPHLERAYQLQDRLTEKDRLYINAWYAIANLDFPAAVAPLRSIIAAYPGDTEAYVRLGRVLWGEERWAEAIAVLSEAIAIDPQSTAAHHALSNVLSNLGRHAEAVEAARRYVALAPGEANAHDALGLAHQWAGEYERAIASYTRALELEPSFEPAVAHLGNAYFQTGKYQQALEQYEQYLAIAPSDSERSRAYLSLARIQMRRGDLRAADVAVRHQARFTTHFFSGIELAVLQGENAEAKRLLSRWVEGRGTDRGSRSSQRLVEYVRGTAALVAGRPDEAVAHFARAVRHRPLSWDLDALEDVLAKTYASLGMTAPAIAEYRRILALNPRYPLARYRLGRLYESIGDRDAAREEYARFLEDWQFADPGTTEVDDARARLGRLAGPAGSAAPPGPAARPAGPRPVAPS